jgi:hypothetical protein
MSGRQPTPDPVQALERSLRDGPPDERGYRPEAIDFSATPDHATVRPRARGRSLGPVPRSRTRRPLFSFADSLVVVLVIVLGGFLVLQRVGQFGSGPSPEPGASPILVPALTKTFVSTRNGISVQYPSTWTTSAATTSWRPGTYVPIGNSALDELKKVGEARLVVASQRLAPGETETQWLASFALPFDLGACSGDRAGWQRLTVDGASGYVDIEACPLPADTGFSTPDLLFEVIVFSGGRVYQIGLDGVVDRAYFEAILATVRFDPASAVDPPAGS